MADITFSCPACGSQMEADAHLTGRRARCPHCHAAMDIPHVEPPKSSSTHLSRSMPETRSRGSKEIMPRRPSPKLLWSDASWQRVRLGFLCIILATAISLLWVVISFVWGFFPTIGPAFRLYLFIPLLLNSGLPFIYIVGYVFCYYVPTRQGPRNLLLVAILFALVRVLMVFVFQHFRARQVSLPFSFDLENPLEGMQTWLDSFYLFILESRLHVLCQYAQQLIFALFLWRLYLVLRQQDFAKTCRNLVVASSAVLLFQLLGSLLLDLYLRAAFPMSMDLQSPTSTVNFPIANAISGAIGMISWAFSVGVYGWFLFMLMDGWRLLGKKNHRRAGR